MQTISTSLDEITIPAPHQLDFYSQIPFLTPNQQHQSTEVQQRESTESQTALE